MCWRDGEAYNPLFPSGLRVDSKSNALLKTHVEAVYDLTLDKCFTPEKFLENNEEEASS
jgi:hypothetical protein